MVAGRSLKTEDKIVKQRDLMKLAVLSFLVAIVPAALRSQTPDSGADKQQLIQQVEVLRREVQRAEAKVASATDGVLKLDADIESRIGDLVALLASLRDSTDSKTRVTGMKKDIMESLAKSIAFYRQRRATRIDALRTGSSSEPTKEADEALRFLDDKVELRIEQILEITASLTQHEEWGHYSKYQPRSGAPTKEYQRHTKNRDQSERTKKQVAEGLTKDRQRLERENLSLKQSLAYAKTDEAKARIEAQIKANEEAQAKRRTQAQATVTTAQTPAKALSKYAAFETEQWVSDIVDEIKKGHSELVRQASQRKNSVANLKMWQDRLSRAEAALAR